jgi:hypothetical protein
MQERVPDWILDLIPGQGERKTARRLKELQREAGTLPIIFALLFTESIKSAIALTPIPLPSPAKFFIASVLVGMAYIYDDKKRRAEQAASKAKDTIYDKIENSSQSQISDYR